MHRFRDLLRRILSATLYRRLTLVAKPVPAAPPPAEDRGVEVGLLARSDVADYLALRPEQRQDEIERRLDAGQRCVVCRRDGEVLVAMWLATDTAEVPYLGLAYELPDDVAYIYDFFTARAARRGGISAAIRPVSDALLIDEGRRVVLGTAWPSNRAGKGLVAARGYDPIGSIGVIRLGPLRIPLTRVPAGHLGRAHRL